MVVRTVSYDGRISRESRYWIHYSREFVENTEAKQHIPGIPTPRGSGNFGGWADGCWEREMERPATWWVWLGRGRG